MTLTLALVLSLAPVLPSPSDCPCPGFSHCPSNSPCPGFSHCPSDSNWPCYEYCTAPLSVSKSYSIMIFIKVIVLHAEVCMIEWWLYHLDSAEACLMKVVKWHRSRICHSQCEEKQRYREPSRKALLPVSLSYCWIPVAHPSIIFGLPPKIAEWLHWTEYLHFYSDIISDLYLRHKRNTHTHTAIANQSTIAVWPDPFPCV